ncbi:MAG: Tim44 domain-containing protein [Zoogloeaceae bacterium]|nr:Tim44 domain-containing protein [Zoogloeaceae bacterium]
MKNLFLGLFMLVLGLAGVIPEAEARRMGGGGSFGMQRQAIPAPAPRPPAAAPQQSPNRQQPGAAPASTGGRSWMGPIAGLAAGLGIAALFAHLGLGDELASFVMLALLAFGALMLFRLLMRRGGRVDDTSGMQYAGQSAGSSRSVAPVQHKPSLAKGGTSRERFDADAFARQAKVQFIRLQAAHDAGNVEDIGEFTTPEVFAEIRQQMAERGQADQTTDVIELNADVIEVTEEAGRYIVSVRFSGLLREQVDAAPEGFDEVWHLTKPVAGGAGWLIAGIQQSA